MKFVLIFSTPLYFEPPTFRNRAIYLKSQTNSPNADDDGPMSSPYLVQFGPRTHENRPTVSASF